MNIQQEQHGAVTVVKPIGPVTQGDAEQVGSLLDDLSRRCLGRVVLNSSAIPFIDSRGLEVLVEINEGLARGGQSLKICGLSDLLREVMEVTDLASSFELFEDVSSAVRSFL
jgi:anti-anti-sigma factor